MSTYTVLVPYDGVAFSQQILPVLCKLLSPQQCTFILLHIAEEPSAPIPTQPRYLPVSHTFGPTIVFRTFESQREPDPKLEEYAAYQSQIEESLQHELEDELREVAHCLEGFHVSVAVRFGDPAKEIIRFIEHESIGLIAMATHARAGIPRMVLGSVAMEVLHHVSVPVLLFRPDIRPE